MLIYRWTGQDWKRMTYVRFQGILDRINRLRRYEVGATVSRDELIAERLEAKRAEADDF